MKLETYTDPFIRACIGIAVLAVAFGLFALMVTPLVRALH